MRIVSQAERFGLRWASDQDDEEDALDSGFYVHDNGSVPYGAMPVNDGIYSGGGHASFPNYSGGGHFSTDNPVSPHDPHYLANPNITVPDNPGQQAAVDFAQSVNGNDYDYGGAGQPGRGYDCSGYQSGIYNHLTGKNVRFNTTSDFGKLGFEPGYDPNSFYNVGVNPSPGMSGHIAGSLGGTNVESGGATDKTMYGGNAVGPQNKEFSQQWHLPNSMIVGYQPPATANTVPTGGDGS